MRGLALLLAISASFTCTQIYAQLRSFSQDPFEFQSEVNDMFTSIDKKKGKEYMEQVFNPFWNDPNKSAEYRKDVYEMGDKLLKKSFKAYPEFQAFFNTLIAIEKEGNPKNFKTYKESIVILSKESKTKFKKYILSMSDLYNDGIVFSKSTLTWKNQTKGFNLNLIGKEPIVEFPNGRLVCYAKRDSSYIYETEGVFFPVSAKWKGKGGRVTWERAGMDPAVTYAEVFNYQVELKSSNFEIDSVLFHNDFFPEPLLGKVYDKIIAGKDENSTSYPLFESFEKRFLIKDVMENMDYDGGFTMKGNRLMGSGTIEEPAKLIYYRDDKPFMVSKALVYTIRPNKIASDNARITIYLSEDSITHPSVNLKYLKEKKQLVLTRTDEGLSKSPFFNTFHNLDMYYEALYWNTEDPVIHMGNLFGSSNTKAAFESKDYYKERRYYALQGIDPLNPLVRVRDLVKQVGNEFSVDQYARSTRLPKADAKKQLIILANQGFLEYFLDQEYVIVRDKLNDYVMDRAGKRDYDILLFNSDISRAHNASLNLVNYDLMLEGVKKIQLSDSQRVTIYPDFKKLTVKQNRDFIFDGAILAGNVELYSKECKFNYDEFNIDMAQIDSVRLRVKEFNPKSDNVRTVRVKNVIEGGEGVLYIDDPGNKSGLKQEEFPDYPIFDSQKESFVYYDNSRIQGGAYDREEFYFKVNPYKLDSLDNFVANNIKLDGTLISGGIFPDIVEPLRVQQDYSLGFEMNTTSGGLASYKGKSNFEDKIILNYNGLQGDGTVEYLTATAIGEQFVFLPDSTIGKTTSFVNRETNSGTTVPEASAEEVFISFIPDEEVLIARSLKEPISSFNGQATMDGEFYLTPRGMKGMGVMDLDGGELESKLFTYTDFEIFADTSDFRLVSEAASGFAFKTENVNAHVDFRQRKGEFKSNSEASYVEFPANEYVCYMDKFIWFMDKNDLALEYDGQVSNDFVIDTDLDLTKSNFWSTNEKQDSLNFMAPMAVYDLDESVITCQQIEFIKVADARISPDSGQVVIRKKARMDPLAEAVVKTNFITEYHTINNASLKIKSANEYEGNGDYTYVDENNQEQLISFSKIWVDSTYQTNARGKILDSDDFSLSPAFQYSGNVSLFANNQNLRFNGQTRVFHDCDLDKNWMNFDAEVDPNEVFIPVDTALTDDIGMGVGVGLYMEKEDLSVYGTFLSALHGDRDYELMSSSGVLTFDKKEQEYVVSSPEKLRERALPGNLIAMNVKSCQVRGTGKHNFAQDIGQVKIMPIGIFENNTASGQYTFQTMLPIDFHFNNDATKKMVEDISTFPDLKPLTLDNSVYEQGLKELVGLKRSDKIISELTLAGTVKKLPSELEKTFVFTDVKFVWDEESSSFLSEGPLGLANIGKKEVFAKVAGRIQLIKKRGGDVLNIYIQLDEENWYYFNYSKGVMQAYSSNPEFNEIIMNTKDGERKSQGTKAEGSYTYMLGSKTKRNKFLDSLD